MVEQQLTPLLQEAQSAPSPTSAWYRATAKIASEDQQLQLSLLDGRCRLGWIGKPTRHPAAVTSRYEAALRTPFEQQSASVIRWTEARHANGWTARRSPDEALSGEPGSSVRPSRRPRRADCRRARRRQSGSRPRRGESGGARNGGPDPPPPGREAGDLRLERFGPVMPAPTMSFAEFMRTMVLVRDEETGELGPRAACRRTSRRGSDGRDEPGHRAPAVPHHHRLWVRKAGKTFISACIGVYMLCFDQHHTQREVVIQASTRDQGASACFKAMQRIVQNNPWLGADPGAHGLDGVRRRGRHRAHRQDAA